MNWLNPYPSENICNVNGIYNIYKYTQLMRQYIPDINGRTMKMQKNSSLGTDLATCFAHELA